MAQPQRLLKPGEVQRLRPGDFEAFYRQQADGVYRALALTLRDVDLAQEAAAEAMARAYQHWEKIRSYDKPGGWAYRVGLNWATSRLRRRQRDRTRQSQMARLNSIDPNEPVVFDPGLQAALLGLEIPQRAVVVLRYFMDLSQDEIAGVLDVPVGTVKSRLFRGRRQLQKVLYDYAVEMGHIRGNHGGS